MSAEKNICDVDPELKAKAAKFKLRREKNIAAISMKIIPDKLLIVEDESYEDETIEDIVADLPEHLPRYLLLSYVYNHDDGRVSYPLCFVFISPDGTKPELQMMYAGSKLELVQALQATKVFELRSLEEFTEEWLKSKLGFFK